MKEQCGFAGCDKGATGSHTSSISSVEFPNAVCVSSLCSEHLWANESIENFLLYNELCHTVIAPAVGMDILGMAVELVIRARQSGNISDMHPRSMKDVGEFSPSSYRFSSLTKVGHNTWDW